MACPCSLITTGMLLRNIAITCNYFMTCAYYPTSSLMLHHILEIVAHLHEYENDELLRPTVVPMKDKFLKF
jgi:hypothetical protein